jgi:hypothetical protein
MYFGQLGAIGKALPSMPNTRMARMEMAMKLGPFPATLRLLRSFIFLTRYKAKRESKEPSSK